LFRFKKMGIFVFATGLDICMKRHGVHSLLMALALVLLQACATDIAANAPKSAPPPKSGVTEPKREAPVETQLFMRGFSPLDDDTDPAVGYLEGEDGNTIGSAVLVTPTEILTAGHCVEDGTAVWFVTQGECYRIYKYTLHPRYKIGETVFCDIAVAHLEKPCAAPTMPLVGKEYQYERGGALSVIGYGGGIRRHSNPGVFFYFGTIIEDPTVFKFLPIRGTVWFGDSGGAVVDADGNLIGIVASFAIVNGQLYENSATRLDLFRDWILEEIDRK